MLVWLILILVGLIVLFLVLSFLFGLMTEIPLPVTKIKLTKELKFIIALSEGRYPEITYSDSADLAFNQKILNPKLEVIRQNCLEIGRLHPSNNQLYFCDSVGVLKLRKILEELSNEQ